jgi:hypothetical protein
VGLVQFADFRDSPGNPWDDLTHEGGVRVGAAAAQNARDIGVPGGATIFCDAEWDPEPSKAGVMAYLSAWGRTVDAAGYEPGIYVGQIMPLTGRELYALPAIRRYWKSQSRVPAIPTRGYCMVQGFESVLQKDDQGYFLEPMNDNNKRKGLRLDTDLACIDGKGHRWHWVVA